MAVSTNPATAQVGDELPTFTRHTDLANWNRYAAVNDEFVPIHMDDAAGQAAGYPTAFGMGNLQVSYLHNMVRSWVDEAGRIVKFNCQFRSPNTRGITVTAYGKVIDRRTEDGTEYLDLEIWTQGDDDKVLAPGHATVALD